MRLVTGQGLQLVGIGLLFGLAGGVAVTRLMTFALYGVSPLDATTWIASVILMLLAGLAATLIPALRATRVNPLVAIQAE
jgi:ABC-type antimicrobial peptide transport system permease subunit